MQSFTLECLTERMTVREVIRARIFQEVQEALSQHPPSRRALIQSERAFDADLQVQRACEAFSASRLLVLVDDEQAEDLDQAFTVRVETEVNFVKLLPLVGG